METNKENLNKSEIIGDETQGRFNKLKEEINKRDFKLSEIGEYDSQGHFIIKDEIKGKDKGGNYIEIRGNKYYEGGLPGNKEGLGFLIKRDHSKTKDILYIGHMKGNIKEGFGIQYYGRFVYRGKFLNDKRNGRGKIKYSSGDTYNGDWTDGKKNGHGIYTHRNGDSLEGDWSNGEFKEGKGIEIFKDGEKYEGDFLLDKNGKPKPFYLIYNDWRKRQIQEGNSQSLSSIHMKGKYTFPNGSRHEYEITNGSITEKSNDFITMYGDNKRDENRSKERGNIEYTVKYSSESLVEYRISSRKRSITWKLEGGVFKFKNKKGKILSIPKTSNFDERKAMHVANLINSIRYINANAHGSNAYRYNENDLCATRIVTYAAGSAVPIVYSYETNGTTLLKDVKKHFGGISAKTLAEWLNG